MQPLAPHQVQVDHRDGDLGDQAQQFRAVIADLPVRLHPPVDLPQSLPGTVPQGRGERLRSRRPGVGRQRRPVSLTGHRLPPVPDYSQSTVPSQELGGQYQRVNREIAWLNLATSRNGEYNEDID